MIAFCVGQITPPENSGEGKQTESSVPKIDEKRLAEIPIKARGLVDVEEEVQTDVLFFKLFLFLVFLTLPDEDIFYTMR